MLRVVLDTSVVVSAFIQPLGPSGRILEHALRSQALRTITSPSILAEYRRSLLSPKVMRRHPHTAAEIEGFVLAMERLSDPVPGILGLKVVEADPDDDKFIVAAVEGMASHLVSGDRDLLDIVRYEGILIVRPREFLDMMGAGESGGG